MFKEEEIFVCFECGHSDGMLIKGHPSIVECLSCGHPNDRSWGHQFPEDY
jgi:Zn ribbon nucleic-acid-binding protein